MSGGKLNSAAISAAVPVGALTLGANYGTETADGFAIQAATGGVNIDQSRNGYGLSATYALSKRTSLIANYANWLPYGGANRNSEANLLVSHSF